MVTDLKNKLEIMKSSKDALAAAIEKIEQNMAESDAIFASVEGLVSLASKFASTTKKTTRGKQKSASKPTVVTAGKTKTGKDRRPAREGTLRSVIVDVLNKHGKEGLALKEVVEKVIAHGGYKSTVDKENFPRLVSQTLYQLKSDKMAAHDKDTRKYSLVEAA